MREIIIITVSIVFVIIVHPIVYPDRSVILYLCGLSEKNAGQKEYYRFRYQDKTYTIPKEEVEAVEFAKSWNIGWW